MSNEEPQSADTLFGKRVEQHRTRCEWSQTELARKMREQGFGAFHQTTISRIEKGERPIRLAEAVAISELFNRPLWVMLAPSRDSVPETEIMRALIERSTDRRDDTIQATVRYLWSAKKASQAREKLLENGSLSDEMENILKENEAAFQADLDFVLDKSAAVYSEVEALDNYGDVIRRLDELWPDSRTRSSQRQQEQLLRRNAERIADGRDEG